MWGECSAACVAPSSAAKAVKKAAAKAVKKAAANAAVKKAACSTTTGGNAAGAGCAFPFTYQGKTHDKCTGAGSSKRWCYTTKPGMWGECTAACVASSSAAKAVKQPKLITKHYLGSKSTWV